MSPTLVTGGSGFIGTNLVAALVARGVEVVNADLRPPLDPAATATWHRVDVMEPRAVADLVDDVAPDAVVHLAARTDLDGTTPEDYSVNTLGTANLLTAIEQTGGVERTVVASSLLVCRNGYRPRSDTDYCPTTPYGHSKQAAEELVRDRDPGGSWVIARPTSIWGPWFGEPYRPFVERVRRGRYVHPGRRPVPKALGYVGNTVAQIVALLEAPPAAVAGRTFYLADTPPYSIHDWADAIARADGRRPPPAAPMWLLGAAGRLGDLLQRTGVWARPPLTSFRVANMTTASRFAEPDLDRLTGPLPFDLDAAVSATLRWLDEQADR